MNILITLIIITVVMRLTTGILEMYVHISPLYYTAYKICLCMTITLIAVCSGTLFYLLYTGGMV